MEYIKLIKSFDTHETVLKKEISYLNKMQEEIKNYIKILKILSKNLDAARMEDIYAERENLQRLQVIYSDIKRMHESSY